MFANFNFAWPVALRGIFNTVSASNLNLQLLAPECSLKLDFQQQWFGVAILPLLIISALATLGGVLVVTHRVRLYLHKSKGYAEPKKPELAPLEGLAFTTLYFLYLQVFTPSVLVRCIPCGA
jgi:hypothetical protein